MVKRKERSIMDDDDRRWMMKRQELSRVNEDDG